MFGTSLFRVLRNALLNFKRNIWLSLATLIIMTLTLLMMSFLYFLNIIGSEVLNNIEKKVDLSAVFKDTITDEQIQAIVKDLESRSDVQDVRIVSSEEALEQFRQRHADNPFYEESLRELEKNPLPTNIYITATEPRLYQNIARQLESEKYAPFIEKVNFENSKQVIERLIIVMSNIRNIGIITTSIFAGLVLLIMFNTIRLAIYSFREEIDIMRLVGASNWFIRGPFVIEAVLVALLSVGVTCLILYPFLNTASPKIEQFFFSGQSEQFDLYEYAVVMWPTIVGLQAALAVVLAVVSSTVAIRRYLRG